MRKKLRRPVPLAQILAAALKHWAPDPKGLLAALNERWREIVGPLAVKTRPLALYKDSLKIGVTSSALANELQLLEPEILKNILRELPALEIRRLRFQIETRSAGTIG